MHLIRCFTIDEEHRRGKTFPLSMAVHRFVFEPGFRTVVFYRISWCFRKSRILSPITRIIAHLILVRLMRVPGVELRAQEEISPGLSRDHPHDIVVGAGARVGENATIYNGVTLGAKTIRALDHEQDTHRRYPVIGNNVTIFAGAKIIGPVTIGDNCIIGANAVVTHSFPANSIVAGIPARCIRTR